MYICLEKNKDGNNALYYLQELGRRRIYRQSYPLKKSKMTKGLKLFTYKNKNNAQKLCDYTNKTFNSNYKVEELLEDK